MQLCITLLLFTTILFFFVERTKTSLNSMAMQALIKAVSAHAGTHEFA